MKAARDDVKRRVLIRLVLYGVPPVLRETRMRNRHALGVLRLDRAYESFRGVAGKGLEATKPVHEVDGVNVEQLGHIFHGGCVRQFYPEQSFEFFVFRGRRQNLSHRCFFCLKVVFGVRNVGRVVVVGFHVASDPRCSVLRARLCGPSERPEHTLL